jgi:hypothetical protein
MDIRPLHDRVVLKRDERQRHWHPDSGYGGREADRRPRDGRRQGQELTTEVTAVEAPKKKAPTAPPVSPDMDDEF